MHWYLKLTDTRKSYTHSPSPDSVGSSLLEGAYKVHYPLLSIFIQKRAVLNGSRFYATPIFRSTASVYVLFLFGIVRDSTKYKNAKSVEIHRNSYHSKQYSYVGNYDNRNTKCITPSQPRHVQCYYVNKSFRRRNYCGDYSN